MSAVFFPASAIPEDLATTTGALFLTRFLSHFCAPLFALLAGTGAYLSLSRGKPLSEVSRFLWTRGLWLAFVGTVVTSYGWTFTFPVFSSGVLWMLGWSMVAMAILVRLPLPALGVFGTAIILLHNLLDHVNPAAFGKFLPLWLLLHGYGAFWIIPGKLSFHVLWSLLPWLGVMAVGYCLGAVMQRSDWRKIVFAIGAAACLGFFFLRFFHLYGNGDANPFVPSAGPWQVQPTFTLTVVSFFNTLKYPASTQFLLMTLGPSLVVLAWFGELKAKNWAIRSVTVFGRVPLFYYVSHIYLIHILAVYTALLYKQKAAWLLYGGFKLYTAPRGYGHGLPFIYAMWIGVILVLHPICWLFMGLKQRHPEWRWLRYL